MICSHLQVLNKAWTCQTRMRGNIFMSGPIAGSFCHRWRLLCSMQRSWKIPSVNHAESLGGQWKVSCIWIIHCWNLMSLNFANKCRCILSESQSKAPASKQTNMEGYTLWTTFNCFLSMMLLRVAPLLTSFQVTGHSHENIRALQARIPGTQTKSLEAISQKLDEMFAFILPLYGALTQGDVVFWSQFYKFLCLSCQSQIRI